MLLPALAFLIALSASLLKGRAAMRWVFVAVVVLAPLRGGLLAIADSAELANQGLAVNGLVPALVAGLALGVLFGLRPSLEDFPRSLLMIWTLIAITVVLNFPFQEAGLKLYAIGAAQYLVYPTLALAVWPLLAPDDPKRIARLFIGVAVFVSLTVLVQAAGIESFIQAATAQVDGFAASRFAGITGSYLHTSAYLGTCAVLAIGELLAAGSRRDRILIAIGLALIFSAINLTFSRSGIAITIIGAAALLIFAAGGQRIRLGGVLTIAVAVALVVGAWGGVTPQEAGDRTATGLSPTKDAGNQLRADAIRFGVERSVGEDGWNLVFGEGLAASGNARQLVDGEVFAVESYYVKLLVETGIVGLLLVGSVLAWAGLLFLRLLFRRAGPLTASVGAAGMGLSLYNVIYPALETQILSLVWWMMLLLAVYLSRAGDDGVTADGSGGELGRPTARG